MPTTSARRGRRALVIGLAVVALVLASCGNSDDTSGDGSSTGSSAGTGVKADVTGVPGVSADTIAFSAIGTNSNNPLGTCVLDCYVQGIRAYFDWRNSEGGVDGRQLELTTVLDDELSKNQERALEVISANDTFGTFNATQVPSGWADLADAGIPTFVWGIHMPEMSGHPEIFGHNPPVCGTCTSRQSAFIVEQAGAKRIAALGYGVSQNSKECAQAVSGTLDAYGDDIGGAQVVYTNDSLAFGLPNGIGPEVTAMKDADVDMVMSCLDLNAMKTLAQELQRQGMGDVVLYHPNTYNQDFVAEAGDLFEGDYVGVQFRPFEADPGDSSLAQFKEWMGKNDSPITELAMVGWINADEAYTALKAAGPDLDRQSAIDAMNQITDYTAGGLVPAIDWSRQHTFPSQDDPVTHGAAQACVSLVQVEGGQFQMVGDPSKPWYCWPGQTWDWSEPVQTNFE
jgi:hypothetical protein